MVRRPLVLVWPLTLATLVLTALPAEAGGGCHTGATQGEGDTVEMVDACFTPSILRVTTGDTVTFVNRDGLIHNVSGSQWGYYEDMGKGSVFTATFPDEGVYPYACMYHPGMTGAIVVGDGDGPGNGAAVTVASYQVLESAPELEVAQTAREAPDGGSSTIGWVAGGATGLALGLALGLGVATLLRHRRSGAA